MSPKDAAPGHCELPAILRVTPKSAAASDFFSGRRSEKPCDFCTGMVANPLVATVVTGSAILRCDFCAAKVLIEDPTTAAIVSFPLKDRKGLSPEFRATRPLTRNKKGPLWRFSAYFPVFQAKKGPRKISAKPWLPVIRA